LGFDLNLRLSLRFGLCSGLRLGLCFRLGLNEGNDKARHIFSELALGLALAIRHFGFTSTAKSGQLEDNQTFNSKQTQNHDFFKRFFPILVSNGNIQFSSFWL